MAAEDNKMVVRRYFEEALVKGDQRVFDELVASDALKQQVTRNRMAFPDLYKNVVVEDLIAEGDKVVVRISTRGTHQSEFRGMSPTGKQVTAAGIAIYRVAGGKVVEHWMCSDRLGMLQQLGATITSSQVRVG